MPTPPETLLCHYHYDPLDRLATCSPSEHASTQRFYQQTRLATEIQGAVQRSIMQHDDQLLAQQQRQSDTVETTWLATDQQRSVLNALDATRPHPLAYTAYGHRTPGGGLLSLLGFNGERPDPVTGHYLLGNGYRAFNPVLMRFNSPDSWSPFGEGGVNAYCVGDPVNRGDPTGHIPTFLKRPLRFLRIINKTSDTTNLHMKNFALMGDGAYTFEDLYKGGKRLNISAHGNIATPNLPAGIAINGKRWSSQQVHSAMINKGYEFESFESIRLISCYSGSGETASFAAEFSSLTKKPVIGFKGLVSDNLSPESVMNRHMQYKKQYPKAPEKHLSKYYARKKLVIYRPKSSADIITFDPIRHP